MDSRDKRDLALTGAGAAGGAVAGVTPGVLKHLNQVTEANEQAEEIVKHLNASGINRNHRIAIVGLPGSGKSTISRALTRRGFRHIPLDSYSDEEAADLVKKGIPKGSVVDHTLALRKTGGGHYDAVVRVADPGFKELRRRLVERGAGAQRMYNRIDYEKLGSKISRDFDKLQGKRTYLKTGGVIAITRHYKAENTAKLPIIGSQDTWKGVHRAYPPKNPIRTSEIIRGRPELHGAIGAVLAGTLVGGTLLAKRHVDNRARSMSSRLDALITMNARLDDLIQFRNDDDEDHLIRNVVGGAAVGTGVGAAGVGAYAGHQAIMSKYGTRLSLPPGPAGPSMPGPGGFVLNPPSQIGSATSKVGTLGAYKTAAKDISSNIGQRLSGATTVGKQAYQTIGRRGGSTLEALLGALKKGAKYAVR